MIGVTGSAGKTTTCWLVRGIFEELQQMTGMIGGPSFPPPLCTGTQRRRGPGSAGSGRVTERRGMRPQQQSLGAHCRGSRALVQMHRSHALMCARPGAQARSSTPFRRIA